MTSDQRTPSPTAARVDVDIPERFGARFKRLLVYKSVDVEEPVDLVLHRPMAAAFAALIVGTAVTPNQVTLASLGVGVAGSVFLYRAAILGAASWNYAVAGVLLFVSVVLDCADGQIARARGGGSRMGRILDGIVDTLVLLPAWVILGVGWVRSDGLVWLPLGLFAGITSWARIVTYDRVKSIYLAHTQPSAADGTDSIENLEIELAELRSRGSLVAFVGMFIYVRVLMRIQDRFVPGVTHERALSPAERQAYRQRHRSTMRWCSFMGLGTHMFCLYVAIIAATWWHDAVAAVHVLFASVFTVLMVAVLVRTRAFQSQ